MRQEVNVTKVQSFMKRLTRKCQIRRIISFFIVFKTVASNNSNKIKKVLQGRPAGWGQTLTYFSLKIKCFIRPTKCNLGPML